LVSKQGKPLLIIAEDVEGEALAASWLINYAVPLMHVQLKLLVLEIVVKKCFVILAILTGGRCLTEDLGINLENVQLADLGQAKRISVDKENTVIVEGQEKLLISKVA
jgi:chaperonin GroEL